MGKVVYTSWVNGFLTCLFWGCAWRWGEVLGPRACGLLVRMPVRFRSVRLFDQLGWIGIRDRVFVPLEMGCLAAGPVYRMQVVADGHSKAIDQYVLVHQSPRMSPLVDSAQVK